MILESKEYWLYLEPHVHFASKQNHILFYNTITGRLLEIRNPKISKIFNVSSIRISTGDLSDSDIKNMIENLIKLEMGGLMDVNIAGDCNISVLAPLSMQTASNNKSIIFSKDGNLVNQLKDCFIYLTNQCQQFCKICETAYKQFPACSKFDNTIKELSFNILENIVNELDVNNLSSLNFLGGNIFSYSKFNSMLELINNIQVNQYFFSHYKNIIENLDKVDSLLSNHNHRKLNIMIDMPADRNLIVQLLSHLNFWRQKIYFEFIVDSEKNLNQASKIIELLNIANYKITPIYTNKNISFFKDHVYIRKKHLNMTVCDMDEIFLRKIFNPLVYGKLYIKSNLEVYSNFNSKVIGFIGKNTLNEIIHFEIKCGNNWVNSRGDVKPCESCIYNFICPPISNYEYAIGKYGLCNINKS